MEIKIVESMGHWLQVMRLNDELYVYDTEKTSDGLLLDNMSAAQANWLYDKYIRDNEDLIAVEVMRYGTNTGDHAVLTELGFIFEEM